MAVEYHLLTCLGRDGTSVTVATTGVITLANHGMRAGHPIRILATSFPGNAAADTTYYVSATDLATGSFKVAATNGGAPLTFTSTGSGVKVIGEYWATLPANDPGGGENYKARYGAAGSERVFGRLYDWMNQLPANASLTKHICLEVQGRWDDTYTGYTAGSNFAGYFSMVITSRINGVYGDGFHYGFLGSGYRRIDNFNVVTINTATQLYFSIDGLEIINSKAANVNNYAVNGQAAYNCYNCILQSSGNGVYPRPGGRVFNNLVHGCLTIGIKLAEYLSGSMAYNNTVVGCGIGINGLNGYTHHVVGNVCVGNTTNWGTAPSGGLWSNNAGENGDTVWTTAGQPSIVGLTGADFKNYVVPVTTASDFSPSGDSTAHTTSSLLVDAGSQVIGDMAAFDIKNAVRPSYKNGSSTNWDVGAYEFDWGYGLAPQQVTIAISGMAEGSILALYKTSDGSAIISPTTIGASGSYSITYSYTGDMLVEVVVRKGTSGTKYLPYSSPGLITNTGFSLIVNQVVDGVLNG